MCIGLYRICTYAVQKLYRIIEILFCEAYSGLGNSVHRIDNACRAQNSKTLYVPPRGWQWHLPAMLEVISRKPLRLLATALPIFYGKPLGLQWFSVVGVEPTSCKAMRFAVTALSNCAWKSHYPGHKVPRFFLRPRLQVGAPVQCLVQIRRPVSPPFNIIRC